MPDQPCPLCGTPAACSGHDYGRRKAFNCQNCTEFIVTQTSENILKAAPQEWKDNIANKAKATPPGQILVVVDQRLPTSEGEQSQTVLHTEYQPQ